MKTNILTVCRTLTALLVALWCTTASAQERRELDDATWTVESPDRHTRVIVSLNRGQLTYSAGYILQNKSHYYVYHV